MKEPGGRPLYASRRFRAGSGGSRAGIVALSLVALAAVGGGGWWLWRTHRAAPTPPAAEAPPLPVAAAPPADTAERPSDLPDLEASDDMVRNLVEGVSSHPRLAAWLVPDDLIRRFVVAVVRVAHGGSPGPRVKFLASAERPADPEETQGAGTATPRGTQWHVESGLFTRGPPRTRRAVDGRRR